MHSLATQVSRVWERDHDQREGNNIHKPTQDILPTYHYTYIHTYTHTRVSVLLNYNNGNVSPGTLSSG